jgi:hypothetical protein
MLKMMGGSPDASEHSHSCGPVGQHH